MLCEAGSDKQFDVRSRQEAVRVQDVVGEVRGWKLVCLLPLWLLRERVPKEECFGGSTSSAKGLGVI